MSNNGKNAFYRTLNLDKELRDTIKEFNKVKEQMMKDIEKEKK